METFQKNVFSLLRNVSKVSNMCFSSSQAQMCVTSFYKFNVAAHSFTYRLIYFTCTSHALMTVDCSANVFHFQMHLWPIFLHRRAFNLLQLWRAESRRPFPILVRLVVCEKSSTFLYWLSAWQTPPAPPLQDGACQKSTGRCQSGYPGEFV